MEDHEQLRKGLCRLINHMGQFTVIFDVVNGFELLTELSKSKKSPDIVLMDIDMPRIDGVAATAFLSNYYPQIKVLACSFYSDTDIVKQCLEAGAKGFLTKQAPLPDSLAKAFTAIGSGDFFIDPLVKNTETDDCIHFLTTNKTSLTDLGLTEKEKMFLQLSATGISYREMAALMHISAGSIFNYQKSLKEKIGISTREQFMIYAIQHGLAKVARLKKTETGCS